VGQKGVPVQAADEAIPSGATGRRRTELDTPSSAVLLLRRASARTSGDSKDDTVRALSSPIHGYGWGREGILGALGLFSSGSRAYHVAASCSRVSGSSAGRRSNDRRSLVDVSGSPVPWPPLRMAA